MRSLEDILLERLNLNTDSKVKENTKQSTSGGARDLENITTPSNIIRMLDVTSTEISKNVKKQEYYRNKGSKPQTLVNTIKDPKKLLLRWLAAIYIGWDSCYRVFRQSIINRGICTKDELDSIIYGELTSRYFYFKAPSGLSDNDRKDMFQQYLDNFNIKY